MVDDLGGGGTAESTRRALDRVIFFSDAVFAIAITLLVLPLTDVHLTDRNLARQLLALWPQVFSFALSFIVIGLFWLSHHRVFQVIVRVDRRLLFLNLLMLMCVAFLPFPTAVLGDHGGQPAADVLYAASMSLLGLSSAALWHHASQRHRLVPADLDPAVIRYVSIRSWLVPATFTPSILVALFSPAAAKLIWVLTFPLSAVIDRWAAPSDHPRSRLRRWTGGRL